MSFNTVDRIDLRGQRVFIRCDFNVPLDPSGRISDDTRIRASLPGIRHALSQGARVMVSSHLGRPTEGRLAPGESLAPVAVRLAELLGAPVAFVRDWLDRPFDAAPGEVTLLENCRANVGEKANDESLARRMAALCDVYVNDAFGTAHRAEASTEALARLAPIACAGPLMTSELHALGRALADPARPLAAIVGGAKVSTKLSILESLAAKVDWLVVGGGMANTFLLAAGHPIGRSLCEPEMVETARAVAAALSARGARLFVPTDVVTATEFSREAQASVKSVAEVAPDEMILDAGPQSLVQLAAVLSRCKTVVWNGPLGVFEIEQFSHGTRALANAIAGLDAFTLAGGGDTVAAINRFEVEGRIDYVSTAGGAFLEFLEGRRLPAVKALEDRLH